MQKKNGRNVKGNNKERKTYICIFGFSSWKYFPQPIKPPLSMHCSSSDI